MNVSFSTDSFGRIVCDISADGEHAIVTSSDGAAAAQMLLNALDAARDAGYGECVWQEGGGEYWWILRRDGMDLTCVLLWSHGTLTGWQHLLRSETRFEDFAEAIQRGLARLAFAAPV
jgi:hypothetical protein